MDAQKASKLFRPDQYSYLLYPYKELKGFLARNHINAEAVERSTLLKQLVADGNTRILQQDINGHYHFNGDFKNANDLNAALDLLPENAYKDLVDSEKKEVLQVFEDVFNHKAFTGRSGTFYGYEGLGSIYWHMVSKLQLAVQECCLKAIRENESEEIIGRLLEHYYEINEGIGVHKSPTLYGAFPTDPYSHTPAGKGAQQPGMTGQVKEDILSRFGELGVIVENGCMHFNPRLLRGEEFLQESKSFTYPDISGDQKTIAVEKESICYTYCQVPVIYKLSDRSGIKVNFKSGSVSELDALVLDRETSDLIFQRTGDVESLEVNFEK